MSEKPIIFSPVSVSQIRVGNKTQTRRVRKGDRPRYNPGDVLWVKETWRAELGEPRWRSPIFMPKVCARLWLVVDAVREERLHEITPEDAAHEGVSRWHPDPRSAFRNLWDSINAKRGYPWKDDPPVWVYVFHEIEREKP